MRVSSSEVDGLRNPEHAPQHGPRQAIAHLFPVLASLRPILPSLRHLLTLVSVSYRSILVIERTVPFKCLQ